MACAEASPGVEACRSAPVRGARLVRCAASLWLALAFDAAGLALLLSGVFADVAFGDLLVYAGGLGLVLSLLWWVFWYAGNLEVPPAELQDDVGLRRAPTRPKPGLGGSVRSLGRRLSGAFARPRAAPRPAPAPTLDLELQPV
ncbi:transmembrane protein 238-like [Paroedura picta]|uniref:transmembrane protein 238-like n=1 Tax=Paroedura picta TaxID=143630 RepID=UPI00101552B1